MAAFSWERLRPRADRSCEPLGTPPFPVFIWNGLRTWLKPAVPTQRVLPHQVVHLPLGHFLFHSSHVFNFFFLLFYCDTSPFPMFFNLKYTIADWILEDDFNVLPILCSAPPHQWVSLYMCIMLHCICVLLQFNQELTLPKKVIRSFRSSYNVFWSYSLPLPSPNPLETHFFCHH